MLRGRPALAQKELQRSWVMTIKIGCERVNIVEVPAETVGWTKAKIDRARCERIAPPSISSRGRRPLGKYERRSHVPGLVHSRHPAHPVKYYPDNDISPVDGFECLVRRIRSVA